MTALYGKDFYKVLKLRRDATDSQIKAAYRKIALRYHPDKIKPDNKEAKNIFAEAAEAYTVLADAQKRAIFDQYGEKTLKLGVQGPDGSRSGGWTFSRTPEDIFSAFFGSANPFAEYFGGNEDLRKPLFKSDVGPFGTAAEREPPLLVNMYCSLSELMEGCVKKTRVCVRKLRAGGKTTTVEEVVKTTNVQPGWKAGTKITFKGQGNEGPGLVRGDLTFVLRELPHPRFKREGNSLIYTASITLAQALIGCTLAVGHLDGRSLSVSTDSVITPTTTQVLPGEGMPNPRKPNVRGDLIIRFDVKFPKVVSEKQKRVLRDLGLS